jgi:hypothetical protein
MEETEAGILGGGESGVEISGVEGESGRGEVVVGGVWRGELGSVEEEGSGGGGARCAGPAILSGRGGGRVG